ncbi:MAG: phosphodiester glycosidase family protein [Gemmatimonadota bacterium]
MRVLALTVWLTASAVPTLVAQQFDTTVTHQVVPGVVHERLVLNAAPWNINVVRVDLRTAGITLRVVHARDAFAGRETLASLASRHDQGDIDVVAAINADFFQLSDGEATNNMVVAGEWWRAVHVWNGAPPVRSQFALTAGGRMAIDRLAWSGRLSTRRYPWLALDGVNLRPTADAVVLFTPRFGASTPRDSASRIMLERTLVPLGALGDTLRFRLADSLHGGGGTPLGPNFVIAGGANSAGRLAALGPIGSELRYSMSTAPDRGAIRELVGGLPRLVIHGRGLADTALAEAEGTNASLRQRHPRSALGFSRDSSTLILVTVDGRQPSSAGMDLAELSGLMLRLGAWEALNLDGGGSTTLLVAGAVVNRPSDAGGPRPIGNALLVTRKRPTAH